MPQDQIIFLNLTNLFKNMIVRFILSIAKVISSFQFSNFFLFRKVYNAMYLFSENLVFTNDNHSFNELIKIKKKNSKNISIFIIPFWGEKYTSTFFEYCLPSLLTKNNLPWLSKNYNLKIFMYLEKDISFYKSKYPYLKNFFHKYNFNISNIDQFINEKKAKDIYSRRILSSFIHHAEDNLKNNSTSINIPVDFVYPNNYLKNFASIIHGKPFCYSHSHIRVNPKAKKSLIKFKKTNILNISNKNLIKIGFENLFNNFKYQNDKLKSNLTHSGYSWRKIDDGIYSIVPGVLGPIAYNYIPEDIKYFKNLNSWTMQDRQIPNYYLSLKRMKCVASSDLLTSLEITYVNKKEFQKPIRGKQYNDLTKGNTFHSNVLNTIVCSLISK